MKKFFVVYLSIFLSFGLFAQHSIKGKITDESGQPLIGVNVAEKYTTIGTVTDVNGTYHF